MGFLGAIIAAVYSRDGAFAPSTNAYIAFALLSISGLFGILITAALLTLSFGHFAAWVWTIFIGVELLLASFIAGAVLRPEAR
jgi:hypothetical protein